MITNYPSSIIVHGLGLNITVQSYDRSMDFGLMADARAMPDVRELADAIQIAFDDLRALQQPAQASRGAAELASSFMRRATGKIGGTLGAAVGRTAKAMMDSAVQTAVAQVTGKAKSPTHPAKARQRRAG
jgi:hypothetical protein